MIHRSIRALAALAVASLASAALAQQAAPAATPAAPLPKHSCAKPGDFPGNLATDTQRRSWQKDYVDYVPGAHAKLVAEHTYDASEYLMKVHKADGSQLDTEFTGTVPDAVTYHAPCHLRAQNIGTRSADVLRAIPGVTVDVVERVVGSDGTILISECMTITIK